MARIDELAARVEEQQAAECEAQAEELSAIADSLRAHARVHLREAEELRGHATQRASHHHGRRS